MMEMINGIDRETIKRYGEASIKALSRQMINIFEDENMKEVFINYYVKTKGVEALVVSPGDAPCHIIKREPDSNLTIEPKPSLCVENEYGSLVVIKLFDSIAEAEATRLQLIHDYCKEEEGFEL